MKTACSSLVTLILGGVLIVRAHQDSSGGDSSQGESCEQDKYFCDSEDPSIFYRCVDQVTYTLHCPRGLHFSVGVQACDWPHLADCSGGEGQAEVSVVQQEEDHSSSASSEEYNADHDHNNLVSPDDTNVVSHGHNNIVSHDNTNVVSHDQDFVKGFNEPAEISWISQAAAAGKSWWRPEGLKPNQWRDVSSIKKPAFQPHIPDEPKSETGNAPKKSESKKSSGESAEIKSGSDSAQTASVDKRNASNVQGKKESCSSNCQLPSCFCAGSSIPKGLPASSVPQMVMLTFDDEVSPAFYGYYQRLFRPGRYNPNGCPIRGCLYVSGSGTDYDLVYPLYAMGVEIASHTVSHRFPHTWWSSASYQDYTDEAVGMRDNLVTRSGIPRKSIKGFRVPFLQLGSDNMYKALHDSQFVYDSSMFTGSQWEDGDPVWPFTLDHVPSSTYCQHGPCPTKQYPGMWEIPVQRWYGLDGHSCSMADGCSTTGDAEETLEYLKSNFRRYYGINRAPFGIFIHARWFNSEHNLGGLDRFIDYLLTLDDVYLVTPSQVIDWMKNPTSLSGINGFDPWSCQGGAKDVWTDQGK